MRPQLLFACLLGLLLLAGTALAGERTAVPIEGAPSRGPAQAPVTIVEFLDFQ